MSNVLRFPHVVPVQNGLTSAVFSQETGEWLVYRQPAGADEPELMYRGIDKRDAHYAGRRIARGNRDRFVIDEGVLI